jgi:hypothetical protein
MRRTPAVALATLLLSYPAVAQTSQQTSLGACVDSLPRSAFVRVPVYLEPESRDDLSAAALASIDSLAHLVAVEVRQRLGAADRLPQGEPRVTWQAIAGDVHVSAFRDGRFRSAPGGDSAMISGVHANAAARLVNEALHAVMERGARIQWPSAPRGDTLRFTLRLWRVHVENDGAEVRPPQIRMALPLFSVDAPRENVVAVTRPPQVRLPEAGGAGRATVVMTFTVDERGRVDAASVRDEWPADLPRPTGLAGHAYEDRIRAIRSGITGARFTPASISGCTVRRTVRMPFVFVLP